MPVRSHRLWKEHLSDLLLAHLTQISHQPSCELIVATARGVASETGVDEAFVAEVLESGRVLDEGECFVLELSRAPHDCWQHAVPYEFHEGGRRYHGWECGVCGELLQTG